MDKINGYELLTPFTTSGTASWCFASKKGADVFFKEFLTPKYPDPNECLPPNIRKSRIMACATFEQEKRKIYDALARANKGNIVTIDEFFLHKTKYYTATAKVDMAPKTIQDVSHMTLEQIDVLVRTLAYCMMCISDQGIVHADLKPDNILLKETINGFYTFKLIDFDSSFFESKPPEDPEDINCDQVYLSPEMLLAIIGKPAILTSKCDVFAFGIILHQMLTGALPAFEQEKYSYLHTAVLNDAAITVDHRVSSTFRKIIEGSLRRNPEDRPTFREIFNTLRGCDPLAPLLFKKEGSKRDDPNNRFMYFPPSL